MKKALLSSIITLALLTSCGNETGKPPGDSMPAVNTAVRYKCPMDCEHGKAYDTIGHCPVCQMDMEEEKK